VVLHAGSTVTLLHNWNRRPQNQDMRTPGGAASSRKRCSLGIANGIGLMVTPMDVGPALALCALITLWSPSPWIIVQNFAQPPCADSLLCSHVFS